MQKNIGKSVIISLMFITLILGSAIPASGYMIYQNSKLSYGFSKNVAMSEIKPTNPDINTDYFQLFNFPPTPIRNVAEFEPMSGVLIRYPFGISYEIIAEMSEDVEVVTIVASTSEQNYVYSQYESNGVDVNHCSFLIAPSDTYWTRDYGPWFVFTGDDELAVIDFSFYGYGNYYPNDNNIPYKFAINKGLPHYLMPLFHEGGNYMTDGQGISASTDMLWSINPGKTHNEIRQIAQDYLGIDVYHVVPDPNGVWLDHIDCWGKFLTPDMIMIREVPSGHSQYDEIEATVDYFENQSSCYGTPYEIVRVYTPNNQPYTNSLILNNKVLVPMTGSPWDDEAIESYEEAMPGYEVLGFTGSWYPIDALHCRTKGIPDRGMLYIEHTPLSGTHMSHDGFGIEARIVPYSNEDVIVESTGVYWKVDDNEWNFIQMEPMGNDYYKAVIPPPPGNNASIHYYIHAEDYSGRSENHPYIGAHMSHSFNGVFVNEKPEKPIIKGPNTLRIGEEGTFLISASDPDDDPVFYYVDWGDGDLVEWDGPYDSGQDTTHKHAWTTKDTFMMKVKARDAYDAESDWATFYVNIPRTRVIILNHFSVYLERFPIIRNMLALMA
jgi:agmatine/peptidylarginine deiminase